MLQGWPFGGRFNRDGASGNGLLCTRFFGTNDQHVVRCHGRGRLSHSRWNSPWLDDVVEDDGDDDDDDADDGDDDDDDDDGDDDDDNKMMLILQR